MASVSDWQVPASVRPKPEDYGYDLDRALIGGGRRPHQDSGGRLHGRDARHRADGTRRADPRPRRRAHHRLSGHRGGRSLAQRRPKVRRCRVTCSPMIRRPASAWCRRWRGSICRRSRSAARAIPGSASRSWSAAPAGASARSRRASSAKQEFAGYWEYVLDEAIFTTPAHPNWGGTALIGPAGDLLGVGSLQMQQAPERGTPGRRSQHDRADRPVEADPRRHAQDRPRQPAAAALARPLRDRDRGQDRRRRPRARRGPAQKAGLKTGDVVLSVGGAEVSDLAGLYRRIWSRGAAGVDVPLTIYRDGRTFEQSVVSSDRNRFFKAPSLH